MDSGTGRLVLITYYYIRNGPIDCMNLERPRDPDGFSEFDGTVIVPATDGEYPDNLFKRVLSRADARGGSPDLTEPLLQARDGYYELDFEALAWLVWEHRQYSRAQEFSVSQLAVLRALQINSENKERVLSREIANTSFIEYSDQTISQALNKLCERGLATKEARGVYRYKGFEGWIPPGYHGDEEPPATD